MATIGHGASPPYYRSSPRPLLFVGAASMRSPNATSPAIPAIPACNVASLSRQDMDSFSFEFSSTPASSPVTTRDCWIPPSPPGSDSNLPLIDQVESFIYTCNAIPLGTMPQPSRNSSSYAGQGGYFTVQQEFTEVSVSIYHRIVDKLQQKRNTVNDFPPRKFRMDYFGYKSLFVITLPGLPHEVVTAKSQSYLRQTLFEQGFYWPSWGNDIEQIDLAGQTTRKIDGGGKRPSSIFQPDGSLQIKGMGNPFIVIEIADSESQEHAREKATTLLKQSKGRVRFAVIIDLVRRTTKMTKEAESDSEGIRSSHLAYDESSEESHLGLSGDDLGLGNHTHSNGSSVQLMANKRAAVHDPEPLSGSVLPKRVRFASQSSVESTPAPSTPSTSEESLPGSPTLPPVIYTGYSRVTVTVLTTNFTPHARIAGMRTLHIRTLVDANECWPAPPPPESAITFTWEDMNVMEYPTELKGKTFTMSWDWLHEYLRKVFTVPDQTVVPSEASVDDIVSSSSVGTEPESFEEDLSSSDKGNSDGSWVEE